ncbi:hypothetical protein HPP92_003915 [Vanilla planifolia]|uniref:Protein kinase domain-containing protein n=1 Tax=Vanilla planifolia TaxID=51239 RepID=A0A835VFY4_VANPL|nr:hypothetical protein HPP92_003915 [Vanilla planifolia]
MAMLTWLRGPVIGSGATATVSLAAGASSGDIFAVKSAEISRSGALRREQSILSALDSPSVVSCLGFDVSGVPGGTVFYNLFLEYAPGGSLVDEIKRYGGRIPEAEIRSRTREILEGIAYLHGQGVVHCDLKPGNVLIGSDGRAKIGDLGCARWGADGKWGIRGSPMYMAPEAARGEDQGMQADVWALGCVLVEMATGIPPWPEVVDAVAGIHRIGFSGKSPAIPAWLSHEARDFIGNCLKTDPAERWTAEQLLRHPFVESSFSVSDCLDFSWISPKSTLDLSFWKSMEDEEDEEEEFAKAAEGRIRELASSAPACDWIWNDGDWIDVRSLAGEPTTTDVAVAVADAGTAEVVSNNLIANNTRSRGDTCKCFECKGGMCAKICLPCKMEIVVPCNKENSNLLRVSNWSIHMFSVYHKQ